MDSPLEEQLAEARRELDALTRSLRGARPRGAIAAALARRDAVLSARRDGVPARVIELAALEGDLSGPAAMPAAGRGADGAPADLRYLKALDAGRRATERGCSMPEVLDRMLSVLLAAHPGAPALASPIAIALADLTGAAGGHPGAHIIDAARVYRRLSRLGTVVPALAVLARLSTAFLLRPAELVDDETFVASQVRPHPAERSLAPPDVLRVSAEESWTAGFAHDVAITAYRTRELVTKLDELDAVDRGQIDTLGKATPSSHRVHRALQRWPVASIDTIMAETGLQVQAATSALHRLRGLGIAGETTRRHGRRYYVHSGLLALLEADVASWTVGAMAGR